MKVNYTNVDWVTATTKNDPTGLQWFEVFQEYVKHTQSENLYNERWANGYYGGVECGGLRWGFNQNLGYIMIASSDAAAWLWPKLHTPLTRITRLDLCVDVLYETPYHLAKDQYAFISSTDLINTRKYHLWQDSLGGSTLYVGSRHSQQYGRLYDKGMESAQAKQGKLWRYEIEFKKPLSGQVAERLKAIDPQNQQREIIGLVANWFFDRGVLSADNLTDADIKPVLVQKRVTTKYKKIAWLRTQVRPTVHTLIEAGLGVDVIHALFGDIERVERLIRLDN